MPDKRNRQVSVAAVNALINHDGSHNIPPIPIASGIAFPGAPVAGTFFYRTDLSALYIYEGGWLAVGGGAVAQGAAFPLVATLGELFWRTDLLELFYCANPVGPVFDAVMPAGGGGVGSLNALTGALVITGSGGITVTTPGGGIINLAGGGGGGGTTRTKTTYTANAHITKTVNADGSVTLTGDASASALEADQSPLGAGVSPLAKSLVFSGWLMKSVATGEDPGFVVQDAAVGGYLFFWSGAGLVLYRYTGDIMTAPSSAGGFSLLFNRAHNVGNVTGIPIYVELHILVLSSTHCFFTVRFDDIDTTLDDQGAPDLTGGVRFGREVNASLASTAYGETFEMGDAFTYPGETP
jgi:hypothetical protein